MEGSHIAYPGEGEHVAYTDYRLDHAMGDAPGGKNGKAMTKDEWREYTSKMKNKTASAEPKKPVQNKNSIRKVFAK